MVFDNSVAFTAVGILSTPDEPSVKRDLPVREIHVRQTVQILQIVEEAIERCFVGDQGSNIPSEDCPQVVAFRCLMQLEFLGLSETLIVENRWRS